MYKKTKCFLIALIMMVAMVLPVAAESNEYDYIYYVCNHVYSVEVDLHCCDTVIEVSIEAFSNCSPWGCVAFTESSSSSYDVRTIWCSTCQRWALSSWRTTVAFRRCLICNESMGTHVFDPVRVGSTDCSTGRC